MFSSNASDLYKTRFTFRHTYTDTTTNLPCAKVIEVSLRELVQAYANDRLSRYGFDNSWEEETTRNHKLSLARVEYDRTKELSPPEQEIDNDFKGGPPGCKAPMIFGLD